MKAVSTLKKIKPSEASSVDISDVEARCTAAMDDDLNSPMVISELFDCVRTINQDLRRQADDFRRRSGLNCDGSLICSCSISWGCATIWPAIIRRCSSVVDMILNIRMEAKNAKDWATSDKIRDGLAAIGIKVKDRKDGFDWEAE